MWTTASQCCKYLKCKDPCTVILFALIFHFYVAISLPFIRPLSIVETSFHGNNTKDEVSIGTFRKLTQIHLGIWGACYYSQNDSACFKPRSPYTVTITENKTRITVVDPSLTRGLALQVFAGGCTLLGFVLAFFISNGYRCVTLIVVGIAGGASALALLMELVVFMTVNQAMQKLGAGAQTNPGPGLWMTLIPLLLLVAAFSWICLHRPGIENINNMQYQSDQEDIMGPGQLDSNHSTGHVKFASNAGRGPFSPTFIPLLSSLPQDPKMPQPQMPQPHQLPQPGRWPPQGPPQALQWQGPPQWQGSPQEQGPPQWQGPPQEQGPPQWQGPPQEQGPLQWQGPPQEQGPPQWQGPQQEQGPPQWQGLPPGQGPQQGQGPPRGQGLPQEQWPSQWQGSPQEQGSPQWQGQPLRQGPPLGQGPQQGQGPPPEQGPPQSWQGPPQEQGPQAPQWQGSPPGQGPQQRQGASQTQTLEQQPPPPYDTQRSISHMSQNSAGGLQSSNY